MSEGEYHPDTYDIESMFEQGGIVEGEDLPEFTKKGEERQLKSLHLIDNRKLPDNEEPPWEGIAMLKGGEYTDKHPYREHCESSHCPHSWCDHSSLVVPLNSGVVVFLPPVGR